MSSNVFFFFIGSDTMVSDGAIHYAITASADFIWNGTCSTGTGAQLLCSVRCVPDLYNTGHCAGNFDILLSVRHTSNYRIKLDCKPVRCSVVQCVYIYILFLSNLHRNRHVIKLLSFYVQLLPALFIPVLSGFLNTMNCPLSRGLIEHEVNVNFPSCLTGYNIIPFVTSILLFLPFALLSIALIAMWVRESCLPDVPPLRISLNSAFPFRHYEWRPDARHIMARSHSRFDVTVYSAALVIVFTTSMLEPFSVSIHCSSTTCCSVTLKILLTKPSIFSNTQDICPLYRLYHDSTAARVSYLLHAILQDHTQSDDHGLSLHDALCLYGQRLNFHVHVTFQ